MRSTFAQPPLLIAFLNPLNLAILALSAAAGLCAAWWLFPLGLIFWGLMIVRIARDPALRIDHTMKTREPLAQRFQRAFDQIEKGQASLFNTLSLTKPGVQRAMQPVQDEVERLVEETYQICQRMSAIENHLLVTKAGRNLEDDLSQLNEKITAVTDEVTRRNYEESKKALEDRLDNLKTIATLLDRFEASLSSISNTIDNTLTETVRLQAASVDTINANVPTLLQAIQAQAKQIKDFEIEVDKTTFKP
jgi:uncharacterized phage infection (PIP) family protein YhgE